ncbi:MAG: SRPBCC family protein [Dongiaceae bacterium]
MPAQTFVYVTYIRTTPETLWQALTSAEFNRQYWFGSYQESGWTPGAAWKLVFPDGRLADSGEIVEVDRPRRLVVKWRNEFRPELKAEGYTRCTFDIVQEGENVRLTVTHVADRPHGLIDAVSGGWPKVLSSLKTLLETGRALPGTQHLPEDAAA